MSRNRFEPGRRYPARLFAVQRKPLENERYVLLRLEFELFSERRDERPVGTGKGEVAAARELVSTGKIACRDIVLGPGVDPAADAGLAYYVAALGVKQPQQVESWLGLRRGDRWVEIVFGAVESADFRNPFASLAPFDPAGCRVTEYDYDLDREWVPPAQAARSLRTSESTIRRLVARHEPEHGAQLVRRTTGNHRRINLPLLRNLII
jgi:hypothetical protein